MPEESGASGIPSFDEFLQREQAAAASAVEALAAEVQAAQAQRQAEQQAAREAKEQTGQLSFELGRSSNRVAAAALERKVFQDALRGRLKLKPLGWALDVDVISTESASERSNHKTYRLGATVLAPNGRMLKLQEVYVNESETSGVYRRSSELLILRRSKRATDIIVRDESDYTRYSKMLSDFVIKHGLELKK